MMHDTTLSQPAPMPPADRDRGSVLTMVLALMVVGSLAVFALLNLATVLFMNRPPIEVRDRTFWSAKSAVSVAMVQQAAFGPNGCFDGFKEMTLNGFAATVTCQAETPLTSGRGRYAVVTTGNDPATAQITGLGAAAAVKTISGKAFVNGGLVDASSVDVNIEGGVTLSTFTTPRTPAARYLDVTTPVVPPATPAAADCATNPNILTQVAAGLPSPVAPICATVPVAPDTSTSWQSYVGDRNEPTEARQYPALPPLPPYTRPSTPQATVGSCQVFFPGQYNAPLTLGWGDYYFASGIYYFTDVITLNPGARIVAGQGRFDGCAVDAEAVYASNAPKAHSVTGRGATFVFGGAGRLVSNDASLRMNRRISDVTTRGSELTAFRSVNFSTTAPPATPAAVEIPDDVVMITDVHDAANPKCTASSAGQPCLQAARDYTSQASSDAEVKAYTPSSLGVNDTIISITQTGGNWGSNRLDVDGYTFVPNAKVLLNGGNNADYRTRVDGGIVASALDLQYNQAPAIAGNWFLGVNETNLEQRFNFYANVDAGNGQRTVSRATLQVDAEGNYAINGWTVDPNAQSTNPAPTPDPTPTPGPPPPPPDPDPTPPPPPDPDPTPDPDPPPPPGPTPTVGAPCNTSAATWTRAFGDGTWDAEYRNLSNAPNNAFTGAATKIDTVANVYKQDNNGSPITGITADHFSARFTRTIEVGEACSIRLRMGGDDGTRVFVNGDEVLEDWTNHSYREEEATVAIPEGAVTIVFEFYERTGSAGYELAWRD